MQEKEKIKCQEVGMVRKMEVKKATKKVEEVETEQIVADILIQEIRNEK